MPIRTNRTRSQRLSERRRRYLVREEQKASREYYASGLPSFGRDEARHARILKRMR